MKRLTKKQKEIIQLMRDGWELHCGIFEGTYMTLGNQRKGFHTQTVVILRHHCNLLLNGNEGYELTTLGKAVNLDKFKY